MQQVVDRRSALRIVECGDNALGLIEQKIGIRFHGLPMMLIDLYMVSLGDRSASPGSLWIFPFIVTRP